ncbi:hypothetical protein [Sandarakinorhabdus sp. DWP1-3-1]|uniref:hypothetical protein n=1 Tax=Sandarakinorhabdus sp. DWP1-3-1 TaxID=2804627 RepID=UPI003CF730CA
MPGRAQGAAISGHLVIRTARGRLILGRTASFPAAVQRVADLGQRAALAMLARDDGALARIRTWPGRSDLGSNIRGLDDHQLMQVVRRAVASRRLLVLAMDDAVATVTVPPAPTGRAAFAKSPPGITLTPAQQLDAAVAAMDMTDKVTAGLQRSAKYMGPELANAFLQLFTLDNLKVMAAFIIAGALANTNPLSAAVFDSAMLIMVFYLAGSAGIEALGLLVTTTLAVIDAKSDADLDRAGEQYAKAFVGLGGAVFMAWLARRIIRERNTGGGGGQSSGGGRGASEPAATNRQASRNDRYLNDRTQAAANRPAAGAAAQGGVAPYEVGTYRELRQRSLTGDRLDLDHQPSSASNLARAEAELGRPLTAAERALVRDEGMVVAVPENWHRTQSPTFGGRNTVARIRADAANPGAAALRDSQAMINGASSADRAAAEAAAAAIRRAAGGN